jgi:hypothetical protein
VTKSVLKLRIQQTSLSFSNTDDSSVRKEEKAQAKSVQLSSNNPNHSLQCNSAFLWTGKRSKLVTLQPSQTMKLEFSVKIFKTGVFNLNHCRVLAVSDTNEESTLMVTQKPPPACLLVVRHSTEVDRDSGSLSPVGMLRLFYYEAVQR